MTVKYRRSRRGGIFGSNAMGDQISEPSGKENRGGITPMTTCGSPSTTIVRPTTERSASKRRFHNASLKITTWCRPNVSSSRTNVRPRAVCAPSASKKPLVTWKPATRSGWPRSRRFASHQASAERKINFVACARQSKKLAGDTASFLYCSRGPVSDSSTTASGSFSGYGRSTRRSIRLKMAAFAPSPSASVSVTMAVSPRRFRSARTAERTSLHELRMKRSPERRDSAAA